MNKVAHQIPRELRCTNLGGLSITPTANKIAAKLAGKVSCECGNEVGRKIDSLLNDTTR